MNLDLNEIKGFLRSDYTTITAILDSERISISNSPSLKILHAQYLYRFWNERPNKSYAFIISLTEYNLENLDFSKVESALAIVTEKLKNYNHISVSSEFEIDETTSQAITEDFINTLSSNSKVVFYFAEKGIDISVRGKIIHKINFFYDEENRARYAEKFHISELDKCLKEYETHINDVGVNFGFFATKKAVEKIKAADTPRNILLNKPEKHFRDNLMLYLNKNTQHTFNKEIELNSKRELDLYTEVNGKKYLIEVKWIGLSIADDETKITKGMSDRDIRKGITQTLEYIEELITKMNYNLHCGYLCVFDARVDKRPIDYKNFDFIPDNLKIYYTNHFQKLEEVKLDQQG